MWTFKSSKTQKITEKLANELMQMDAAPHDRALSERRLAVYERMVRSGQWRPITWAIAECEETGARYRVNGKHTSTLFSRLASEFPDHTVTVEVYECPTLEDVGRLYGTFDSAIGSRTVSDINRSFAATIPELAVLPRKIIDTCASAIAMHLAGGDRRTALNWAVTERAENLIEYCSFVLWVSSILQDTPRLRHICRQGVVAAMFASFQKSKKEALEFWTAVRDETGDTPDCPDRQLSRFLLTTSVRPESDVRINSKRADSREFYVRSIHCWNAWRRGEKLDRIKYHIQSKIPAVS